MTTLRAATALTLLLAVAAPTASAAPSRRAPAKPASRGSRAAAVLPWIENDYAKALKAARARQVPIFVDIWAPW